MINRIALVLGTLVGAAGAAQAGEPGCGSNCYRETTLAPVYGTVSERVLVSPPRTYDVVTPAEYRTETYQISGGGRQWQVTRDAHGRAVGCWVDVPPRFGTRTVMVRAATSEPHTTFPVYGTRERSVLVEPARRAWVPLGGAVARGPAFGGHGGGVTSAGYGGGDEGGFDGGEGYGGPVGGGALGAGFGFGGGYGGGYGARAGGYGGGVYGRSGYRGGGYGAGRPGYGSGRPMIGRPAVYGNQPGRPMVGRPAVYGNQPGRPMVGRPAAPGTFGGSHYRG